MKRTTIAAAGLGWLMLAAPAAEAEGNRSYVIQKGTGNAAEVVQIGRGNISSIVQIGNGNMATVRQTGDGNRSVIFQLGDRHVAESRQTGGERGVTVQAGKALSRPQYSPAVSRYKEARQRALR